MALAQLITLYGAEEVLRLPLAVVRQAGERNVRLIARLIARRLNTPPTSSAGRLFDAVAALVGVPGSRRVTYEGQAAVELELAAHRIGCRSYPFQLRPEQTSHSPTGVCNPPPAWGAQRTLPSRREGEALLPSAASGRGVGGGGWVVETGGIIAGVVDDVLAGRPVGEIAAAFHRTMVEVVVAGCAQIRRASGVRAVALSGGTFQNVLLLEQVVESLTSQGFLVYRHRRVPANDGGLALGQAVLASRQ
jgi:hydrogenase maturation protein HypF